ncbi:MAG: copper resistance system multicopper oxidase [Gammaproteobacteria bacterium]|nr:copper resistance system multicopper oxidase [Gammaproteobacteria bacterium]
MSRISLPHPGAFSPSRRRFVTGLAAGGALLGLGINPATGRAAATPPGRQQVLSGTRFDLTYSPTPINLTGAERQATAINGTVPAPVLRWREGDTVTLKVTNHLAEDASIHWHGLILPSSQDGVPHISDGFEGIPPGESFTYQFPVKQSGTYWYHSHSGFHEQTGSYGAIIIDPAGPEPFACDRDYALVLSDWSDEDPNHIYATLKKLSHYYNFRERTIFDALAEIREKGWAGYRAERDMWDTMRMSDRDISDVTGYTYTFLMNGVTPAEGWKGLFRRGERVRLRIINAAAMTFFDLRIPGLEMTVVAADGQNIEPVTVDELRLGVAETYDVIVRPQDDRPYTVFAQAIDRSGYARGTLTPDLALAGEVPEMDPAPILTHGDMGMDMAAMGHAGHDMGANDSADGGMPAMDHSGHDMGGMDHSGHDMGGMEARPAIGSGTAGYGSSRPVVHADTEYGPHIDMRADAPQYRLDDPGVGLRDNGRRVLTYADLFNIGATPDPREPGREIDLHLTGNMSRYMWSMDGIKFADAEPLGLKFGERVRINLINDTMMNHPIHLHGMWSDLETGDPGRIPRKHTVIVQPGARISYLVTADAMGGWAYHCHLLYHMPGMFRKVVVS